MKVLIVGGGKTLYFLCRNFTSKGYEVVIINRNQKGMRPIGPSAFRHGGLR
jgi:Trk K+ transport system NAD-binding subunit